MSVAYDNFYTPSVVAGIYTYDFPGIIADGPNTGDQLILQENGKFQSDTWGEGIFTMNGSELRLVYNYEFGKAVFSCNIYRRFFWEKPRISIVRDLNYYFKKND